MEKQPTFFGSEDKPLLSIQRARELLNDTTSTDEELEQILLTIQQFTEMVYQLHQMKEQTGAGNTDNTHPLSEDFDEILGNAA